MLKMRVGMNSYKFAVSVAMMDTDYRRCAKIIHHEAVHTRLVALLKLC